MAVNAKPKLGLFIEHWLFIGSFDGNVMTSMGAGNDTISSVKVAAGYEAVLFENWDYSGASVVVSGPAAWFM